MATANGCRYHVHHDLLLPLLRESSGIITAPSRGDGVWDRLHDGVRVSIGKR